ncbi:MAG TPA: VTT domain-containing protein [Candidatus Eisenbacteria bacterium]|nr:VTT domain-containing protein [Candidatus Eisenbacteria bacterium]
MPPEPKAGPDRRPHAERAGAIAVLVILAAALVWGAFALAPHLSREKMETWVRGAGLWGPLLLLGIQAAQILAAPIPGVFVPVLAGLLYGPVVGPAITVAGSVVGSAAAYWIGRSGRPLAERLVGADALRKAQHLMRGRRWIGLATIFLLPFTPVDALCFVAGIVAMEWKRFALAVVLGRVPKDAAVSVAAALGFRLFD